MRSAAPVSLQSDGELGEAYKRYWETGTAIAEGKSQSIPNPLLVGLLSGAELLAYGTDPVLGYMLATAYAPLTKASPLRPQDTTSYIRAAKAAQLQFNEWISAFKAVFRKKFILRLVVADIHAFCHTLQHAGASGQTSANLYRRQQDMRRLSLDGKSYGKNGKAPKEFDLIDTSNLSDHSGALNILVSTAPLLKSEPWATVYTELLIKREGTEQQILQNILCGDVPTLSLLLGISPVQHWTNAKCESHVDEVYLMLMNRGENGPTQYHVRVAWKADSQLSGQQNGRGKIHIEPKALARVIFQIYLRMFEGESMAKAIDVRRPDLVYPPFHRGSLAALLKLVKDRVETDWPAMCVNLVEKIVQDRSLALSTNFMQDFCAQLHILGVDTEPWMLNEVRIAPELGGFFAWKNLPPVVAVTIQVPRQAIDRLYPEHLRQNWVSPTITGSLKSSPTGPSAFHSFFGAVQIVFGRVKETNAKDSDDYTISVEQDSERWSGSSPLVASFYVPTAALQVEPKTALTGLCVSATGQNVALYGPILGPSMAIFETQLGDASQIFISKMMPGQSAYPIICGAVKPFTTMTEKGKDDKTTKLLVDVPESESIFNTITGHLDITSARGKGLLKDKVAIELRQESPFIIDIVFGKDKLVCPLKFPIPVESVGSKTRIARTSGYIEVIAPISKAGDSSNLADFIFPVTKTSSGVPATLNTPHLNLDNLPILDLMDKDGLRWLTTFTSFQFSARERRIREQFSGASATTDNRLNFKESLFTMFMLASGLQGGQTGLFSISHPQRGGIHILILVSAIRLDGDTASVVLDAAVIALTKDAMESGKVMPFLEALTQLEMSRIFVNDAELALWKKLLPSLAERCRTWSHKPNCEYKQKDATIPLSLDHGQQVLCSCGNGRLPDNFVSVPCWDIGKTFATRIALSPTFAVPFVEEVVDRSKFGQIGGFDQPVPRCRACRKTEAEGVTLKKCTRCKEAQYCSAECQKKDWKKHRMECEEA